MRKIEPKSTANARKIAKIERLESLVAEVWNEILKTFANADPMLYWRAEKLQEAVDAEIDSTWRCDEVLWHRLFLARADKI